LTHKVSRKKGAKKRFLRKKMARTQQTTRQAPPTRDEVAQGLVVTAVHFTHTLAAPSPGLSANRCRFLCEWIAMAHGANVFAAPVDWQALGLHDYPSFVPYPMDFATICASIVDGADFDFGAFLDKVRLVWANACRYNPPGHDVHELARRLARIFDAKVIELQQRADDDDPIRLNHVYGSLVCALEGRDGATVFVSPVDPNAEQLYAHHIEAPICLSQVKDMLAECRYYHRSDIEADLRRIWANAIAYGSRVLGDDHWVPLLAKDLTEVCDRLLAHRRDDVDLKYVFTNAQRLQLFKNVEGLTNSDRQLVVQKMKELNSDAIVDLPDGTATGCIDSLSLKQFVVIDSMVRRALVKESRRVTTAELGSAGTPSSEASW
jgi:hypothetical protein